MKRNTQHPHSGSIAIRSNMFDLTDKKVTLETPADFVTHLSKHLDSFSKKVLRTMCIIGVAVVAGALVGTHTNALSEIWYRKNGRVR